MNSLHIKQSIQIKIFTILLSIIVANNPLAAQKSSISLGYSNYLNPSFRHMQQVFYFARPWLPQPPNYLQNGLNISFQKQIKDTSSHFHWRATSRLFLLPSSTEQLPSYLFLALEPNLCYQLKNSRRVQIQFGAGITLLAMKRNYHSTPTVLDSEFETAFGVGIDLNGRFSKQIVFKKLKIFAEFNLQPLSYFRDAEVLLNDTKELYGRIFLSSLTTSIGFNYSL